jgi:hypothetical protein
MTAVAGCVSATANPRVIDIEGEGRTFSSTADVEVTLENEGSAGEVRVFVETYDGNTLLDRYGDEIYMEAGERRRVSIRVDAEGADHVEAEAEAV